MALIPDHAVEIAFLTLGALPVPKVTNEFF
jgi:hypothetical protein